MKVKKVLLHHDPRFAFGMMVKDVEGLPLPEIAVDDFFEAARSAKIGDRIHLTQYRLSEDGHPYVDLTTEERAKDVIEVEVLAVWR